MNSLYESKAQRPLSPEKFRHRLALHAAVAAAIVTLSLAVGMVGYVVLEHLSWIDAFLNASMLLGGMGPVNTPVTFAGKLFAGIYALYAGLVFLVTAALVFTPIFHRIIHRFHWSEKV